MKMDDLIWFVLYFCDFFTIGNLFANLLKIVTGMQYLYNSILTKFHTLNREKCFFGPLFLPTELPEFDFPLEIPLLIVIDECCPPIDGGIDL